MQENLPLVYELKVSSLPSLPDENVPHVILVAKGRGGERQQVPRLLNFAENKQNGETKKQRWKVRTRVGVNAMEGDIEVGLSKPTMSC